MTEVKVSDVSPGTLFTVPDESNDVLTVVELVEIGEDLREGSTTIDKTLRMSGLVPVMSMKTLVVNLMSATTPVRLEKDK